MPNFVGLALLIMVIFLGCALIYLGYKLFSPVSKEELEEFKQKLSNGGKYMGLYRWVTCKQLPRFK